MLIARYILNEKSVSEVLQLKNEIKGLSLICTWEGGEHHRSPTAFCRSASEQYRENYSLELTVRKNLQIRSLTDGLKILLLSWKMSIRRRACSAVGKTSNLTRGCQNLVGRCKLSQDNEAWVLDSRGKAQPALILSSLLWYGVVV